MKIGIFDSGIGGLSVFHAALQTFPEEQFIYYADTNHVPYGEKSVGEIVEFTDQAISFMVEKQAKAIVIACNTATSAAITRMRDKYALPIVGMEPAIKKAVDTYGNKRVLVAATPVTVKGQKLKALIGRLHKEDTVDLLALPELVRYAEQGEFESAEIRELLTDRLSRYDLHQYGAVVLGCTHFNYFKDSFRSCLPDSVALLDGNAGTVNRLYEELKRTDKCENNCQTIEYYYSGQKLTDHSAIQQIEHYLARLDKMLTIC